MRLGSLRSQGTLETRWLVCHRLSQTEYSERRRMSCPSNKAKTRIETFKTLNNAFLAVMILILYLKALAEKSESRSWEDQKD